MLPLYWQETEEGVLGHLKTSHKGLSPAEAKARLLKYGPNQLSAGKKRSAWGVFFSNFKSPLIYILILAAVVSFSIGKTTSGFVILIVVLINAIIGFFEEYKAERTIDSLKKITTLDVTVIRGGEHLKIISTNIVPGDIIVLEEGSKIPADGRLIISHSLQVDEAVLTGESALVDKKAAREKKQSSLDAKNIVFMGTTVATGRGEMVVTDTGKDTEFGKITKLVSDEFHSITPLQKKLNKFSNQIAWMVGVISVFVYLLGTLGGRSPLLMFETSISLAVSAIPEGLPVAITIILVLGMKRMAKKKAIIRKLSAVETLGTTTVIASDKTGTLTHNKLMVTSIFDGENLLRVSGEGYGLKGEFLRDDLIVKPTESLKNLLMVAALANDGKIKRAKETEVFGDPTDCALLVVSEKAGIDKKDFDSKYQRLGEIPFSSDRGYMATINQVEKKKIIFVKGAFERILHRVSTYHGRPISHIERGLWLKEAEALTREGLRVIALAKKTSSKKTKIVDADIKDLDFVGFLGMKDNYRSGAKKAIEVCKKAGIKVIMLTGDHLETAKRIGHDLGILKREDGAIEASELEHKTGKELEKIIAQTTVFARIRPDTKYKIIETLKKKGEIVAMTGDGVNDVPALTKADIGVAMGAEGTDAAKEAADMVLTDDNFSTIVIAVEEGRTIFENIRKVIFYLLSTSLGEVMAVVSGLALGLPLILTPLQILWMNMVTDTAATIPLGMEPTEEDHLKKPPRDPHESILTRVIVRKTLLVGGLMAVIGVYLFQKYLPYGVAYAQTVAFSALVVIQWFNALNARSERISIFRTNPLTNISLLFGISMAILVQVILMSVPFLRGVFGLEVLSVSVWLEIILLSSSVIGLIEIEKLFARRKIAWHQSLVVSAEKA